MTKTEQHLAQYGLKWASKGITRTLEEVINSQLGAKALEAKEKKDPESEQLLLREMLHDDGYLTVADPVLFMDRFNIDSLYRLVPAYAWRDVKFFYSMYTNCFMIMRLEFAVSECWDRNDPKKNQFYNKLVKGYELKKRFHRKQVFHQTLQRGKEIADDFVEQVLDKRVHKVVLDPLIELLAYDFEELALVKKGS